MPGPPRGAGDAPLPPELDPRGRRRGRTPDPRPAGGTARGPVPAIAPARTASGGSTRHRALLAARVVAAVLSLVVLVGSGWAWSTYKSFDAAVAEGGSLPSGGTDKDGRDQNILLIGNDSRAGASPAELAELSTQDDGGSVNTDTMIVLHVPADGSRATMISFPRDAYVAIPGYGKNRINAAYSDAYNDAKAAGRSETAAQGAGAVLTAATISQLTGLHIDHYLQINLLGFYRISQAIGGVQVCLNGAMRPSTSYGDEGPGLDAGFEPDGTYIASYSGIDLPAGVSTIEGKQALAFVRQRHGLPGGDLDRIARQQYFLRAVFSKVKSAGVLLNPFKLNDLLDAVSSSLLKDPGLQLLQLARQVQDLSAGNITSVTMQTTGDETVDGMSVLGVDPDAVRAQVAAVVGPTDSGYVSAKPVAPSAVTVTVLNGSGVTGAAAQNADRLRTLGFVVPDGGVGDAQDSPAATVVQYPEGQQAAAKTLAAAVPGAQVALTPSVQGVTLVLGRDGLGVADPAAAGTGGAGTSAAAPTPTPAPSASTGPACIN